MYITLDFYYILFVIFLYHFSADWTLFICFNLLQYAMGMKDMTTISDN